MSREADYVYTIGTEDSPIPFGKDGDIRMLSCDENATDYSPQSDHSITFPSNIDFSKYGVDDNERFYGEFIRRVVTSPSMMGVLSDLMVRMDPTRTNEQDKSYSVSIYGDPGIGKTYVAKQLCSLLHERGAYVVNANSIEDTKVLYQVTTYNETTVGKQRLLDARLRLGLRDKDKAFDASTIEYLEKMFGDAVSKETREVEENGEINEVEVVSIDWESINEGVSYIDNVLEEVFQREGIKMEGKTGMGFVVSNGPILESLLNPNSPNYGRPIIIDEFSRLPEVDAYLQIIEFFSDPSVDKITLQGEDDRTFTVYRNQIPENFALIRASNHLNESNASSVQEMSDAMNSRDAYGCDLLFAPGANVGDFQFRMLHHLTGTPTYYLQLFTPEKEALPTKKATTMRWRTCGLTEEEKSQIPQEQIYNIEHLEATYEVGLNAGAFFYAINLIKNEAINNDALPQAYRDFLKKDAIIDLRYIKKVLQHSKMLKPEGVSSSAKLDDRMGVLKRALQSSGKKMTQEERRALVRAKKAIRESRKYDERGVRFENEVKDKLQMVFYPATLDDYLSTLSAEEVKTVQESIDGIWKQVLETAKKYKFEFGGYVGEDSIANVYSAPKTSDEFKETLKILTQSMREVYGTELNETDVVDSHALMSALELLETTPEGRLLIVPKHDIVDRNDPLGGIKPVRTDETTMKYTADDLISANQFIDSLLIKQTRIVNMDKLSQEAPKAIIYDGELTDIESIDPFCIEKPLEILKGKDKRFVVSFVNLSTNKEEGSSTDAEICSAHIIYDRKSDKTIIISDFDISDEKLAQIEKTDGAVKFVNASKITEEQAKAIENIVDEMLIDTDVSKGDIAGAMLLRYEASLASSNSDDGMIQHFCVAYKNKTEEQCDSIPVFLTKEKVEITPSKTKTSQFTNEGR